MSCQLTPQEAVQGPICTIKKHVNVSFEFLIDAGSVDLFQH